MFSHLIGPFRFARLAASVCIACGVALVAYSQELTTPWLTPGPNSTAPTSNFSQNPAELPTTTTHGIHPGDHHTAAPASKATGLQTSTTGAGFGPEPVVHRIKAATERMEMTANSSRVISLDQNIPRAQVNNREILELTALSPNEIQVFAKKPGVTQINLWNEQGQIYTIDCVVFGDARELAELIRSEFPAANIRVRPLASSVLLSGFVDRPDQVSQIISLAQDYYPTVKSSIQVGGVQQILLHVKVAEVSRTKLRGLGVDFATRSGSNFLVQSVGGLISAASVSGGGTVTGLGGDTVRFGVVDGSESFFGFIEALRRNDLMKVLAEPTLTTVSGRPAYFNVGGEFPILVPQSLGTVSIEFKKYGTQVDFVPIVLGNGNIRLEVRPRVSELDPTRSVTIQGTVVPGLRVREVDTGVEMKAGQTLALAGLVQNRLEARNSGIPWLADLPYVGVPFRRTRQEENEIELLIMVTPEIVDALDPCEAPHCLPGMHTDVPNDCELYFKGYMEVPSKGPCGPGGCTVPGADGMYNGPAVNQFPNGAYEEIRPGTQIVPNGSNYQPTPSQPPTPPPSGTTAFGPSGPRTAANPNNRYNPSGLQNPRGSAGIKPGGGPPGFIGPVGYDVVQ